MVVTAALYTKGMLNSSELLRFKKKLHIFHSIHKAARSIVLLLFLFTLYLSVLVHFGPNPLMEEWVVHLKRRGDIIEQL